MPKETEIEFKCLITNNKYLELLEEFNISCENIFEQTNHYFRLPSTNESIRVRVKGDTYTFTHKLKFTDKIIETNQPITKTEFENLIKNKVVPLGEVKSTINIDTLEYITFSTTKRTSFPYLSGELFIDYTIFENDSDYELEYEAPNFEKGQVEFNKLLSDLKIPYSFAHSKIKRAIESIKKSK